MVDKSNIQRRFLHSKNQRLENCLYVFADLITETVDSYHTILTIAGARKAVAEWEKWRNVREMHEKKAIGTVPIIEITDNALRVGFKVLDPDAIRKVENGIYKGVSIGFNPIKWDNIKINGEEIVRFLEYDIVELSLVDRPSNPDAVITYFTRSKFELADKEEPWTFDWKNDADAIIEKLGYEGMQTACLYYDKDNAERKSSYKLPVMKIKNGKLTLYYYALVAAMAALNGARGGVDLSNEDKNKIYDKLKKYYKLFGEEATELRLMEVIEMDEKELQAKVEGGIVAFFERVLGIKKEKKEQIEDQKKDEKKTVIAATAIEHAKALRAALEDAKDTENVAYLDKLLATVEQAATNKTDIDNLQKQLQDVDALQKRLADIEKINKDLQAAMDQVLTAQKSRRIVSDDQENSIYKGAFIPY